MRIPCVRKVDRTREVRLLVEGNGEAPYTLMIEPWGMTYDIGEDDRILVDLELPGGEQPSVVAWPGGLSIFAVGRAVTRDQAGRVLNEF